MTQVTTMAGVTSHDLYEAAAERYNAAGPNYDKVKAIARRMLEAADAEYNAAVRDLRVHEQQPGVPLYPLAQSWPGRRVIIGMGDGEVITPPEWHAATDAGEVTFCELNIADNNLTELAMAPGPAGGDRPVCLGCARAMIR